MKNSIETVERLSKKYRTPQYEAMLRANYRYDPATGLIHMRRKVRNSHYGDGEVNVGYLRAGYRMITPTQGVNIRQHVLAWFLKTGLWPERQIDHRNGKRSDNRWRNLRLATIQQQRFNAKRRVGNQSGCKGVDWVTSRKVWRARITVDGKEHGLGFFKTFGAAKKARQAAEKIHFGDFVRVDR